MQICSRHWEALREGIKERGLDALVADSGEEARHRLQREVAGEETLDTFDPLMYANMQIIQHSMELLGVFALQIEGCVLCWMSEEHERTCTGCILPRENAFDEWVTKAADVALARYKFLLEAQ